MQVGQQIVLQIVSPAISRIGREEKKFQKGTKMLTGTPVLTYL